VSDVKDASAVLFVTPIVKSSYTICKEPISFTFCLDFSFLKKKEKVVKLFNVVWNEGETTPGLFDFLVLVSMQERTHGIFMATVKNIKYSPMDHGSKEDGSV